MTHQMQTAVAGINRREFLGVMGAGAAIAYGVVPGASAATVKDGGTAQRVWIDPRIHTLPKRPWRKIHQDFQYSGCSTGRWQLDCKYY